MAETESSDEESNIGTIVLVKLHWNLTMTYLIGMGFYLAPSNFEQTSNGSENSAVNVQLTGCTETVRKC